MNENIYNENNIYEKIYEIKEENSKKKFNIVTYISGSNFYIKLQILNGIDKRELVNKYTFNELKKNNNFLSSGKNLKEISNNINKLIMDSINYKNFPVIEEDENEYKLFIYYRIREKKAITFSFKKENNKILKCLEEIEEDLTLLDNEKKNYEKKIDELKRENENLKNENEKLKNENEKLKNENEKLKNENKKTKKKNENENLNLTNENEKLKFEKKNLTINYDSNINKFERLKKNKNKELNLINNNDDKNKDLNKNNKLFNPLFTEDMKKIILNFLPDEFKKNYYQKIFNILYKASRDGNDPNNFHKNVDGFWPLVIIIQNEFNRIYVFFTSIPWSSGGGLVQDSKAFYFVYNINIKTQFKFKLKGFFHTKNIGPNFVDLQDYNYDFKKYKDFEVYHYS